MGENNVLQASAAREEHRPDGREGPAERREPRFGFAIIPEVGDLRASIELVQRGERAGLEFVTVLDHPYNPALGECWTMMTAYGLATSTILVRTTVVCTPLRQAAVLARGASTLDLLTEGRVELGLGAGGVWEGITSVGGHELSPGQSVEQLGELIAVLRALWQDDDRTKEAMVGHYESVQRTMRDQAPEAGWGAPITIDGIHHHLRDAYSGPRPAHPIPIFIGGHGPRMLRLAGSIGDGIALSHGRMDHAGYAQAQRVIDDAAREAGRDPVDVVRMYGLFGTIAETTTVDLGGRPGVRGTVDDWVEHLVTAIVELGFDDINFYPVNDESRLLRYAEEVVPAVRERVAAERRG